MRPTSKQLTYIRRLALNRGISFTPPATKTEASQLIGQLNSARAAPTPSAPSTATDSTPPGAPPHRPARSEKTR